MNLSNPENNLLHHLYEKILSGELRTFASLEEYVAAVPDSLELRTCLVKAFGLQKKLYWGYFINLSPKKYPRLWKEIVIPGRRFSFGGTLKRSMSIPEIYMGLLDIHGYTKFCYDKKRNMSMIDLLDRMIYEDVKAICAENSVLSKRARGDEILILGGSAVDILETCLQLMEYFNTQGRSFPNTVLRKNLPGTVLPQFKISAGIAGGQKFTPLMITRDGDISGDIVNTAARLQAKANKISPYSNRIMITSHVYQKIRLEEKPDGEPVIKNIDYFKVGAVEFKGISLTVYDLIFLPEEAFRLDLKKTTEELMESLQKKQWKSRIFNCALNLAAKVVKERLERCRKETFINDRNKMEYTALLEQIKSTADLFNDTYYETAITIYSRIVDGVAALDQADPIALEYLQLIRGGYNEIYNSFTGALDSEIDIRKNEIFEPGELDSFLALKRFKSLQIKLQAQGRIRLNSRKKLWHRTTDELCEDLRYTLQSLK